MRIVGIGPASGHSPDRTISPASAVTTLAPPHDGPGTALISLERRPMRIHPIRQSNRPNAAFVTHLIATAAQEPQTRLLRRASATDALARYRLMTRTATAPNGTATLSRTA